MKKTISLLLCVLICIGLMPQISYADEFQDYGEYEETILNCEYEVNLSQLSSLYETGYWPGKPTVTYKNETEEETGRTYATVTYAQKGSGSIGQSTALSPAYTPVVGDMYQFEQVFKVGQNMSLQICLVMGDDTTKTAYYQSLFNADGTIPKVGEYIVDKWYTLKIIIDTNPEVRTAKFYIDDSLFATTKYSEGFYIPRTYQMIYGFQNIGDYCVYDSLVQKVRYNKVLYDVTATSLSGEEENEIDNLPLKDGKIKLAFSQDIENPAKKDIKFLQNGEEIDFSLETDGKKTILITPSAELSPRSNCRITFDTVVTKRGFGCNGETFVDFKTMPSDFHISYTSLARESLTPGEIALFDLSVRSTSGNSREGIVLIGIYKDNALYAYAAKAVSAGDDLTEVSLAVPECFDESCRLVAHIIDKTTGQLIDAFEVE